MNHQIIQDKIMFLAGVGGGIGATIVKFFAPKVKKLISTSRTNSIEEIWNEEWGKVPENYIHYSTDLTQEGEVKRIFNKIMEDEGKLDILVNTIGGSLFSHKIEDFPIDEYDKVMKVNLRSAFLLTKEAIRVMKQNKNDGGNIVHFVSSSAKKISRNKAPYGIAKAGLSHLIHYAAAETAEYNIKVNGITPTYVFTPRHWQDIKKKAKGSAEEEENIIRRLVASQILKKRLNPENMMDVLEILISTEVITGQIYNITLGEVMDY